MPGTRRWSSSWRTAYFGNRKSSILPLRNSPTTPSPTKSKTRSCYAASMLRHTRTSPCGRLSRRLAEKISCNRNDRMTVQECVVTRSTTPHHPNTASPQISCLRTLTDFWGKGALFHRLPVPFRLQFPDLVVSLRHLQPPQCREMRGLGQHQGQQVSINDNPLSFRPLHKTLTTIKCVLFRILDPARPPPSSFHARGMATVPGDLSVPSFLLCWDWASERLGQSDLQSLRKGDGRGGWPRMTLLHAFFSRTRS